MQVGIRLEEKRGRERLIGLVIEEGQIKLTKAVKTIIKMVRIE